MERVTRSGVASTGSLGPLSLRLLPPPRGGGRTVEPSAAPSDSGPKRGAPSRGYLGFGPSPRECSSPGKSRRSGRTTPPPRPLPHIPSSRLGLEEPFLGRMCTRLQCPRSVMGVRGAGARRSTPSLAPTCTPDSDWGRGSSGALADCRVCRGESSQRGKILAAAPEAKRRFGCALLTGLTSQKFVLQRLSLQ